MAAIWQTVTRWYYDRAYRKLSQHIASDFETVTWDDCYRLFYFRSCTTVFIQMPIADTYCDVAVHYQHRRMPRDHFLITIVVTSWNRVAGSVFTQIVKEKTGERSESVFKLGEDRNMLVVLG